MKNIYVRDVINYCGGKLICGDENLVLDNFSKDTRDINEGDIYVGITGNNFDGNLFYKDAFSKGAKACILEHVNLDEIENYKDKTIILVEDSIVALQKLAKYKRSLYDIIVIAVTGSVGKTSTKDMIASVLSEKYKVLKTQGNNNNHIGLPLTILKLKDEEALVLEMGMNHFKEISLLTDIAKPTLALITNIGTAHIGDLGSRENILKAKLEIIEGLSGPLIINNDNDLLHNLKIDHDIITIGIDNKSDYQATDVKQEDFSSTFTVDNNEITVNMSGKVFIYNALMSYVVGKYYDVSVDGIKKGILNLVLSSNRLEKKVTKKEVVLIDDTYNASYDAVKNALNLLSKMQANRRIAILGDMLDLGEYSKDLHQKVGREVVNNNVDILITIGNESKEIDNIAQRLGLSQENIYHFAKESDTYEFLDKFLLKGDVVLLKGSHGMGLTNIVNYLMK